MATIDNYKVKIEVDGQQKLDKASDSMKELEKNASSLKNSLSKLGGSFSTMNAGIGIAATAFAALSGRAINAADTIQDLSDATDISAGRLLNFKQSIIDAGGGSEDFEKITLKLTQTLGDAAQGNEKVRKTFRDLGVSLGDANGNLRNTDELLPEIIQALGGIDDKAQRAAVATEILGKSAARIDWSNVRAINDPFKDEQIAQIAKYRGAIDALSNSIETSLITMFGKLALEMQETFKQAVKIEDELAKRGKGTYLGPEARSALSTLFGIKPREPVFTRDLSEEEKRQAEYDRMAKLMAPYKTRAGVGDGTTPQTTGELAISDAGRQAIAIAKAQTKAQKETNAVAQKYQMLLNDTIGMQDYQSTVMRTNLQIDRDAEVQIAQINRQIENELANKERDQRVTAAIVDELRKQQTEIKTNADIMKAAKTDELAKLQQQKNLMADIALLNQKMTQDLQISQLAAQNELIGLYGDELKQKQGLLNIDQQRASAVLAAENKLRQLGKDATNEDRARTQEEIAMAQDAANKKVKIFEEQLAKEKALRENAKAGVERALYDIERSFDPIMQGQMRMNALWDNMNNAIDTFVETGKFKFSDFAKSIIRDLIAIELKASAVKVLSAGKSFLTSLLGFADGGQPPVNKPSIVGEKGPELFVPKVAGTIIPNHKLGGMGSESFNASPVVNNYNYNISAVDAQSVARLFANNRQLMLGTIEQARKELPIRQGRR